jgi:Zn finger protein HypA/HybF involved in hydrogenase expression
VRGTLLFGAGVAIALATGWVGFPRVIYETKPQPVDFSHKVHTDEKGGSMKCEDCHAFRDDGSFAAVPTLEKCSGCHSAAMGTTAAEKRFIEQYVTPNREPVWQVYSRQPENVYFSHVVHVKRGKVKCEECHLKHGSSDTLPANHVDRISGYSREVFENHREMNDCVACHNKNGLKQACLGCHK